MYNKVTLLGRLAAKPEMVLKPDGTPMLLKFRVATGYKTKTGEDHTEFHSCVAFGKLAEIILNKGDKGDPIFLEGSLNTRKWVNKDNVTMYSTSILAKEAMVIKPKKTAEENIAAAGGPWSPPLDDSYPEKSTQYADAW